jgi:hypothetical protein
MLNSVSLFITRGMRIWSRPSQIASSSCRKNDAPIAEISAASREAPRLRSGR